MMKCPESESFTDRTQSSLLRKVSMFLDDPTVRTKLETPEALGPGTRLSRFRETRLIRLAGRLLFGKGSRTREPFGKVCSESGSKICPARTARPSASVPIWAPSCVEKLPAFCASVKTCRDRIESCRFL